MMVAVADSDRAVDVSFALQGQRLLRDHADALRQAICQIFSWLKTDEIAAVLPIKLVGGTGEHGLLSKRTRLIFRVKASRVPALIASTGAELSLSGCRLRIEDPHVRELNPHATLYAYKVASIANSEVAFMELVNSELRALAIGGERVCGKLGQMSVAGQPLDTYSLMLHALPPEQSLRLQQTGLGHYQLLGCGVFVPHKSAAAV